MEMANTERAVPQKIGMVGRIIGSSGAGLLGQFVNVVHKLLLPPMFLDSWGVGIYGDWLLVSSITAYIALADIGGGLYISNRLNQLYSSSKFNEFKQYAQTAISIFVTIPFALFILIALLAVWVPNEIWDVFENIKRPEIKLVVIIFSLQVFIGIPQLLIFGFYRAIGRMARGTMMANGLLTFQLLGLFLALTFGLGPLEVAILQFLPVPLFAAIAIFDVKSLAPNTNLLASWEFSQSGARGMIRPSLFFFLIQLSQLLSVHGTLVVAGLFLGSTPLVAFATIRTLANVLKSILSIFLHAAWPEITRLESKQEKERLVLLFVTIVRANLFAAVSIGTALLIFGESIYTIWLQGKIEYNATLMSLTIVLLIQQVVSSSFGSLLMATNNHHKYAVLNLVSACISVLLACIGALYFGLEGLVYGAIVAELIVLIGAPILVFQIFPFIPRRGLLHELSILLAIPFAIVFPLFGVFLAIVLSLRFGMSMITIIQKTE